MGVTLSLSVTESNVSQANNTSVVKAVLKAKSTSGSFNSDSRSGYITIDGTKYTFSHSFAANTTTTLATKSKTVTHNSDGSKTITVKGWYSTDVSSGDISTSKTVTLTKISRQFTVSFNANGGSGAPSSQTKTYGTDLKLSSTVPTRGGYIFNGWATSSTGEVVYAPGDYYSSEKAITLYAVWEAVNYTISFNANGGTGAPSSVVKPHDATIALPITEPTRNHYKFKGWSTTSSGTVQYVAGGSYDGNANATLYAVWEYVYTPPTIKILDAYRTSTGSSTAEVPSGTYVYVRLEWSSDSDWSPPTISVKCNNVALTGPTITGHSGIAVFRGSNLSKNTTGNIVATITDRSSQSQKTATASAVIGKSIVPFRLKPDAAEFGAGAWFGGDIRVGGEGFHDSDSIALMDLIYPVGTILVRDSNDNPGDEFGGSWSLVDADYEELLFNDGASVTSSTMWTRNTTNCTSAQMNFFRSKSGFDIHIIFVNKVAITDTSADFMTLNLANMGVNGTFPITNYPIVGWSDGGEAVFDTYITNDGIIRTFDLVVQASSLSSSNNSHHHPPFATGSNCQVQYHVDVPFEKKLLSACNKFYFKRTA